MRWVTFVLVAALALTLQVSLAPSLELLSARPDFLLIVMVFLSLFAPLNRAIAQAWVLGACGDLLTIERFGVIALSYGLTAMIVTLVREYVFRYRLTTQAAVSFISCLLVHSAWTLYYHAMYDASGPFLRDWVTVALLSSAYTSAVSAAVFRILSTIRWTGMGRPRYTYTATSPRN